MSDPVPTLIYPPGLSEPVILPRQAWEIRIPDGRRPSRLDRAVLELMRAGVASSQRPRGARRRGRRADRESARRVAALLTITPGDLAAPPPAEEWTPEACERLLAAVREVPAGRVRRALWVAKGYVRAAVGR